MDGECQNEPREIHQAECNDARRSSGYIGDRGVRHEGHGPQPAQSSTKTSLLLIRAKTVIEMLVSLQ